MLVLVDQDGVLADFTAGFDAAWQDVRAEHPHAPYIPPEQCTTFKQADSYPPAWHDRIAAIHAAPGFFRSLPPMPGAVAAMNEMLESGHDVRICTAPTTRYENCVLEKYEWVEEHLGRDWVRRLLLTKDKTLVAGDVLIDDKPYVTGSLAPTWHHARYDAPYNRDLPGPRLTWDTYAQVLAEVESYRRLHGLLITRTSRTAPS